jgi:hypothetical protein
VVEPIEKDSKESIWPFAASLGVAAICAFETSRDVANRRKAAIEDRHADDSSSVAGETTVTREMSVDSTERRALSRIHKQVSQAGVCNLATAALNAADSGRSVRTLGFIAARPRGAIAAGVVKSAWSALLLIALLLGPFGVAGAAGTMVSTPAAAALPSWRRSTPAMSTGWSPPGAIAPAI